MRIVKRLGLVLVAVCAFSALAVSSASAAPTFLAHPPGGLLLASVTAGSKQVLKTAGGNIECTTLKLLPPGDTAPATLQALRILVVIDYEKCTAFGLAAVVHPVHYLIDANGLVTLVNTVLVTAPSCTVTVPAEKNQSLNSVLFHNNPANRGILLLAHVSGVTSVGVGAACTYAEESNGIATGTIHITYDSSSPIGVIRWDP
jgi:hypothetical protein